MKSRYEIDEDFLPRDLNWDLDELNQAHQTLAYEAMNTMDSMLECALRDLRVHIPLDEVTMINEDGGITIVTRGFSVFRVKLDMVSREPSVSSQWLMWPPPAPMVFGLNG